MFDFLSMAGTLDSRKVDRNEYDWGFISTVSVNDGSEPYETAVKHTDYNDGAMVIVEAYGTKQEAADGHGRWVETMQNPPESLPECDNAAIAKLASVLGKPTSYPRLKT